MLVRLNKRNRRRWMFGLFNWIGGFLHLKLRCTRFDLPDWCNWHSLVGTNFRIGIDLDIYCHQLFINRCLSDKPWLRLVTMIKAKMTTLCACSFYYLMPGLKTREFIRFAGNRNQVLMFASEDDATRFALMLEAQDFPPATVEAMDSEEIKEFWKCDYDWELVPDGALALPPETNVEATDWWRASTSRQLLMLILTAFALEGLLWREDEEFGGAVIY